MILANVAGPQGFEPRIPGFHRNCSEGIHDHRSLCLILAGLRALVGIYRQSGIWFPNNF